MAAGNTDMPLRQFRFFRVAISISKTSTTCGNVESLNAPRKPHFWLAGPILPLGYLSPSCNCLWAFLCPLGAVWESSSPGFSPWGAQFSFSATANLGSGRTQQSSRPVQGCNFNAGAVTRGQESGYGYYRE